MKYKTSMKAIEEGYNTIISIGYCKAQALLRDENPIAYSSGKNGWNCDYYEIDGVLISTGYSRVENKNTKTNYDTIQEYNRKAELLHSLPYLERKEKTRQLLSELIKICEEV